MTEEDTLEMENTVYLQDVWTLTDEVPEFEDKFDPSTDKDWLAVLDSYPNLVICHLQQHDAQFRLSRDVFDTICAHEYTEALSVENPLAELIHLALSIHWDTAQGNDLTGAYQKPTKEVQRTAAALGLATLTADPEQLHTMLDEWIENVSSKDTNPFFPDEGEDYLGNTKLSTFY